MKKLLLSLLLVIGMLGLQTGQAFANFPNEGGTTAPPAVTPSEYQIDVSTLPHATATSAKVQAVLAVVFTIIGAISLLMVTIGGFRYVASQGDPQAVSKAKGTIIYALVGIFVSMTAVAIVTFVIGRV